MAYKDPEKARAYRKQWQAKNLARRREQARQRRAANLEAIRAYDREWKRQWRQTNPEASQASSRKYYVAHPERRAARAEYGRAWRAANPERVRALNTRYRLLHRDRIDATKVRTVAKRKTWRREYYRKHKERILVRRAIWAKNNRKLIVLYSLNYRARKLGSGGNGITPEQWEEICAAVGHRCAYCHKKFLGTQLTRDHITPVGEGPDDLHNIVPACQPCNTRKRRGPAPNPVQPFLLTVAPSRTPRKRKAS